MSSECRSAVGDASLVRLHPSERHSAAVCLPAITAASQRSTPTPIATVYSFGHNPGMRPLIAMERSVNKLTSKTIKPLKPKHVQILTGASWQREIPISELFRYINHRLREDHWVITFKALITIHILMREGATDRVLGFIVSNPGLLRMHNFRDRTNTALGQEQSKNLRAYSQYLEEKVAAFKELKVDFVRSKADMIARLRSLPVEDGLLKEVELLQKQIDALLGCTFYLEEIDNVVTLQAFRLLIGDMMALFHLLNESVIRILGEYFEMSKSDAERALQIYKNFATQTTKTVEFFDIARRLKHALGMDVPAFKHAPVSLAGALEDYLKAPDFEAQRMAYKEKKGGKTGGTASASAPASKGTAATSTQSSTQPTSTSKQPEKPAIDFFSSLDDELSAFQAPAVQAQYNTAADPFGGLWGGGQDGGASAASNPFGAVQTTNPFALKNQELQQQTQDINSQLQALQAGLNTFNVQGAADPFGGGGGAGGQMVLASQGGFPMLQQQQSQSQFGGYSPFAMPQQQQQQPQGFGAGGGAFTVENVFGNNDAFGSGGGGAAPATRNNPFGGPTTAALPAPLATQQSSTDPFAGLGLPQQQPSTTNPTLDPFGLNRQPTTFGNNGMQQGAFAALQGQATGAGSLNNPFASTGQPQQQQQQPFAPRSTTTTTGGGGV
ncbi:ANTH domain-containing protein [Fimicolochytrium jonesii]|uniref:ANTH domain-containing protein n=1 Tax=Fimicolochytrium jonesii TaxID=1396493 RepID=UPI0022FE3C62|nr:ANTH domain-containing protein [Fimicolochytrium jonesii]KAI8819925.1 ANTH domain-containing protein [Fimicolochytrium jonesii]